MKVQNEKKSLEIDKLKALIKTKDEKIEELL